MNEKGKKLADFVLQRLCKNAEIGGIRFGPILQILLVSEQSKIFPIKGQVYLNLSSALGTLALHLAELKKHGKLLPVQVVKLQL